MDIYFPYLKCFLYKKLRRARNERDGPRFVNDKHVGQRKSRIDAKSQLYASWPLSRLRKLSITKYFQVRLEPNELRPIRTHI